MEDGVKFDSSQSDQCGDASSSSNAKDQNENHEQILDWDSTQIYKNNKKWEYYISVFL